ncbi:MAG: tRNA dihydrouridine(20/20a) synthase DusA [Proteobacteria bacterium]|nr:tRNA dihydrouridine(20/20a) synthase DusA [Pseudomonadota bacterium]
MNLKQATTDHRKISIAPMMDWTDRHCRYFMRLLSPSCMLYTEMVTAAAIDRGDVAKLLRYDESEHPIALQLGGNDPAMMTQAAQRAEEFGYDEININIGCPSDRVISGQFGACLMRTPDIVAACYRSMRDAVDVPVTIKNRIGIDDHDSYEFLENFVETLSAAGCSKFVVHARIAILGGMSPKDNRSVPPLNYERVFRLKREHPELEIVLNGGVQDIEQIDELLQQIDGVMIGRQAYHHPYFLVEIEHHFRPEWPMPDRQTIVERMLPYIEEQLAEGERLSRITRHMLGLFAGQPGARAWRRHLSENDHKDGAGVGVILDALKTMPVAAQAAIARTAG